MKIVSLAGQIRGRKLAQFVKIVLRIAEDIPIQCSDSSFHNNSHSSAKLGFKILLIYDRGYSNLQKCYSYLFTRTVGYVIGGGGEKYGFADCFDQE